MNRFQELKVTEKIQVIRITITMNSVRKWTCSLCQPNTVKTPNCMSQIHAATSWFSLTYPHQNGHLFWSKNKILCSDAEWSIREKRCHTKWTWFREEGIFFHAHVVNYWTCFLLLNVLNCLHIYNNGACKKFVCNIMVLVVFHILFHN